MDPESQKNLQKGLSTLNTIMTMVSGGTPWGVVLQVAVGAATIAYQEVLAGDVRDARECARAASWVMHRLGAGKPAHWAPLPGNVRSLREICRFLKRSAELDQPCWSTGQKLANVWLPGFARRCS